MVNQFCSNNDPRWTLTYFLQNANFLVGIHLNIWNYNVFSIKLEQKELFLYKIRVIEYFILLVNEYYSVHIF